MKQPNRQPPLALQPLPSSHHKEAAGMNFCDRSVSRSFRDGLAQALPGLADNHAYWRMTQQLLFGTWKDLETSRLLLPNELIAAIEKKKHDKNYVSSHGIDRT